MTNQDTLTADHLTLKWGTLKSWNFNSKEAQKLLEEYGEIGSCLSAMLQKDTPRQKEIICELIDKCDVEEIYLDWDGKCVSKEEAKRYVIAYGREEKNTCDSCSNPSTEIICKECLKLPAETYIRKAIYSK